MVGHGEVYRLRPSSAHLTWFYLALAVGGVGGRVGKGREELEHRASDELGAGAAPEGLGGAVAQAHDEVAIEDIKALVHALQHEARVIRVRHDGRGLDESH